MQSDQLFVVFTSCCLLGKMHGFIWLVGVLGMFYIYIVVLVKLPNCAPKTQMKKYVTFRSKRWVINSRRIELLKKTTQQVHKNYKLCSNHFEDSQFMYAPTKRRLVHNAVPTLFDIPNPPENETVNRKHPTMHTDPEGFNRNTSKGKTDAF